MTKTIKISLVILSALVAAFTSYRMQVLNQQDMLWGILPLFWMLGVLFTVFFAVQKSTGENLKKWLYATATGILLWLGFPTMPFTPLLFVAFVPLLLVQRELLQEENARKRTVFKYAYYAFLLWNILSTYWVANAALAAGLFAVIVNAFLMCIPFVLYHTTSKILNERLAFLSFIAYWITFEKLHQYWELSWTWLTLGNAFSEYPSWIQWYEYTGVFGGSLWILLANVFVLKIVERIQKGERVDFTKAIRVTALVILPIIVSVVIYYNQEDQGNPAEVVVIQPNFEPHHEKFKINERTQLRRFLDLSQESVTDNTDYLLFPETSFRSVQTNDFLGKSQPLRALKQYMAQHPKLKLVMGVSALRIFDKDEPHPNTIREYGKGAKKVYYEGYNAAIQLQSGSNEIQLYKKSIFVPGAENFPYGRLFPFFKPLVDKLGGTIAGLGGQAQRSVFTVDNQSVAPVICYESIYGEYCTGYVKKGAKAIFIVTNDGWWDDTMGHRQHLLFARLRAIETRRSIARSANSGVSAFINQRGDISQATSYGEATHIKGTILLNDEITFYTIWGDLIARIALFTAILMSLNTFVKGRIKK